MHHTTGQRPGIPIACDLSGIPADQRDRHVALVRTLFGDEAHVHRLDNGLEVSIAADSLADAVSFIDNERRCCRHLAFSLEVPAAAGPLVLRVTGPGAVEELQALMQ